MADAERPFRMVEGIQERNRRVAQRRQRNVTWRFGILIVLLTTALMGLAVRAGIALVNRHGLGPATGVCLLLLLAAALGLVGRARWRHRVDRRDRRT